MEKSSVYVLCYTWTSETPYLLATERAVITYIRLKDQQKQKVENKRVTFAATETLGKSFAVRDLMRPLTMHETGTSDKAKPRNRPNHE